MDKNVGLLIGGVVVAGAVAFLSLAPSGTDKGTNPGPAISSSPATVTSPAVQPVDQSTAQAPVAATPAKPVAKTPTTLGGGAAQIGTARGGDDEEGEGNEGRHRGGDDD